MASSTIRDLEINPEWLKLIIPFRIILSGPSGSGKSEWVYKILQNLKEITTPEITQVIYLYGEKSTRFDDFKHLEFFTTDLKYINIQPKEGE